MSLNLCQSGHEQICFDGYDCPLCKEQKDRVDEIDAEVERLEDELSDARAAIEKLEEKVYDLEDTISTMKADKGGPRT